jgi:hypothetical protein
MGTAHHDEPVQTEFSCASAHVVGTRGLSLASQS